MTVIIDQKEKEPWTFPEGVKVEVADLRQGDYALKGDGTFSIERKSLKDFIGTVGTTDWARFQREMHRMDIIGTHHKVIIVEGDFASFLFHEDENGTIKEPEHDRVNFTPQLACKRIAELTVYYRASVLFAADPGSAAALAFHIFTCRQLQIGGRIYPKDLL